MSGCTMKSVWGPLAAAAGSASPRARATHQASSTDTSTASVLEVALMQNDDAGSAREIKWFEGRDDDGT